LEASSARGNGFAGGASATPLLKRISLGNEAADLCGAVVKINHFSFESVVDAFEVAKPKKDVVDCVRRAEAAI
jgi:hypothetical protein